MAGVKRANDYSGLYEDNKRRAGVRPESKYVQLVYKEGEPLQGLQELWKQGGDGTIVEVVIPPDQMSKDNRRVKSRQIWGDLVYTPDSDVVAVLMHLGCYAPHLAHPPSSVIEVHVLIKLLPAKSSYPSKTRFVKSRAWSCPNDGCAYQVERCWVLTRSGAAVELPQCIDELPATQPTVQPQANDRHITTRNTGSKGRQSQEVSVQFNLCNEPWLKYTLAGIADKGLKSSQWTSARLHHDVLFLETSSERYQIAYTPSASEETGKVVEAFSLSRCKTPLPGSQLRQAGMPLPADQVEVMETALAWEELQWGASSVQIRGKEYQLKRMHFMPMRHTNGAAA